MYVFALSVAGIVYSRTASPSITCAYSALPFASFSVTPFSLNITRSPFILSPLASSTLALSVMVCPALAVKVFFSNVMVDFPLVMFRTFDAFIYRMKILKIFWILIKNEV